jgi:hypothetical protein
MSKIDSIASHEKLLWRSDISNLEASDDATFSLVVTSEGQDPSRFETFRNAYTLECSTMNTSKSEERMLAIRMRTNRHKPLWKVANNISKLGVFPAQNRFDPSRLEGYASSIPCGLNRSGVMRSFEILDELLACRVLRSPGGTALQSGTKKDLPSG